MTVNAQLTAAALTFAVTGAPDTDHHGTATFVPHTADLAYTGDGPRLTRQVTITGTARLQNGTVGSARRWVRFEDGHQLPEWVKQLVQEQIPEGLPGGEPTLRLPGLHLTAPTEEGEEWSAGLGRFHVRGATPQAAKAALAEQVLAALTSSVADPAFGRDEAGNLVVSLPRPWGTDFYTVTPDGYSSEATDLSHSNGAVFRPDSGVTTLPPRRPGPSAAERERLRWEIDACSCVEHCDQDRGGCSRSGTRHVHPRTTDGHYGPCPVHPDAPGDH